jgi:hypothetical protein
MEGDESVKRKISGDLNRMSASGRNPSHIEHFIGQRREHYKGSPLPQAAIEEIIVLERRALETLETLPQLNGAIAQLYQHDMISEAEATVEVEPLEGFGVPGLTRMESSAQNYDCLIHSFLTATCDNFRRLPQHQKNVFANHFRRVALPALPMIRCFMARDRVGEINDRRESPTKGKPRPRAEMMMERILAPRGFLHETELHLLAAQFRVNILAATAETRLFQPITRDTLQVLYGDTGCMNGLPAFDRTVCIFTSGGHFESVRKEGGYNFTQGELARFPEIAQAAYNKRAPNRAAASAQRATQWECPTCTFLNPNTAQVCGACGRKPEKASKAEGGQNLAAALALSLEGKKAALKAIYAKMEAGENLDAEEVKILEAGLAPKAAIQAQKAAIQAQINAITAKRDLTEANISKIAELLGKLDQGGGRRTRRKRHKRQTRRT